MKARLGHLSLCVVLATGGSALAADGAALYAKRCASCHGKEGKNGKDVAIAGRPEDVVAANIQAHPLSMNSFHLSKTEVTAIAKYVAGLKP
ncbi:MAG: c-type cytochrome [Myxococcaceae bacterium]